MQHKHPVFAINLKERPDRLKHIREEFRNREEFNLQIISAKKNKNGGVGLWKNVVKVVKKAKKLNYAYMIICEDDHQFTKYYKPEYFRECILKAQQKDADVLMGGVSWFKSTIQVSAHLFWVDQFSGLQFTVIFQNFFDVILSADFKTGDAADYKISELTNNKLVAHPFISIQKEFGYSDATLINNFKGQVAFYFKKTPIIMNQLAKVKKYYNAIPVKEAYFEDGYDKIVIPTYIINLPERADRLKHIREQFLNKNEFEVNLIEACKHQIGAVGLWQSILKIVKLAIQNDDDVIIICEDDHQFTEHYSRDIFLQNVIDASGLGIDLLSGGIGGFGQSVHITKNKYWIDSFYCTQFIVLYKNIFQKILDEKFDDKVTADGVLSAITSNKLTLYPFISVQKEFGYSDVTPHNEGQGAVNKWFMNAAKRLDSINSAFYFYENYK